MRGGVDALGIIEVSRRAAFDRLGHPGSFGIEGPPLLPLGPANPGLPRSRAEDDIGVPMEGAWVQCRETAGESDASLRALADILLGPKPPPSGGLHADERPFAAFPEEPGTRRASLR